MSTILQTKMIRLLYFTSFCEKFLQLNQTCNLLPTMISPFMILIVCHNESSLNVRNPCGALNACVGTVLNGSSATSNDYWLKNGTKLYCKVPFQAVVLTIERIATNGIMWPLESLFWCFLRARSACSIIERNYDDRRAQVAHLLDILLRFYMGEVLALIY